MEFYGILWCFKWCESWHKPVLCIPMVIYIWKMTVEIVDLPIQNDDIPIYIYMEYIGTNMMGFNGI